MQFPMLQMADYCVSVWEYELASVYVYIILLNIAWWLTQPGAVEGELTCFLSLDVIKRDVTELDTEGNSNPSHRHLDRCLQINEVVKIHEYKINISRRHKWHFLKCSPVWQWTKPKELYFNCREEGLSQLMTLVSSWWTNREGLMNVYTPSSLILLLPSTALPVCSAVPPGIILAM